MFSEWGMAWANAGTAGHSEVEDEGACNALNQDVFGSSLDSCDGMAFQGQRIVFDGPPHASFTDGDVFDGVIDQMREDATSGGFYFGEFGHAGMLTPGYL